MNKPLLITLGVINIPCYGVLASVLFGKEGFLGALRYAFIPDLISALKGHFWDDKWAELMMVIWIALCVVLVLSEYSYIENNFPSVMAFLGETG